MEREHPHFHTDLTGIHINLEDQAIEFDDRHGTVGRLVFTGESVLYEGQPLLLTPIQDADPQASAATTIRPRRAAQPPRPSHKSSQSPPRSGL